MGECVFKPGLLVWPLNETVARFLILVAAATLVKVNGTSNWLGEQRLFSLVGRGPNCSAATTVTRRRAVSDVTSVRDADCSEIISTGTMHSYEAVIGIPPESAPVGFVLTVACLREDV